MLPESTSAENPTLPPEVSLQRASLAQYVCEDVLGPNFSLSCLLSARVPCLLSTSHKSLVRPPPVVPCLVTVTISHTSVSAFPADCTVSLIHPCSLTALSTDLPGSTARSVLVSRDSSEDLGYECFLLAGPACRLCAVREPQAAE